jgi:hypothetical protein
VSERRIARTWMLPLAVVGVSAIALIVCGGFVLSGRSLASAIGPAPSSTPVSIPEPAAGQTVTPRGPTKRVVPIAGQPLRIRIPSIGLNTVVGSMSVASGGVVDPPTPRTAYWLRNYGIAGPAATNTVYIAGHTCHGRCSAVFNPLLDIPDSATTVHTGDQVIVTTPQGDYDYTVESSALYPKTAVESEGELWRRVPGRLVLVTCFQYKGGTSSQQNYVIYAQLDG